MPNRSQPVPEGRPAQDKTAARKRGGSRVAAAREPALAREPAAADDPGAWEAGREDSREPGADGAADLGVGSVDGRGGGSVGGPGGGSADGTGGREAGSEEAARAICLRLLNSAPRTRAQLATALRKRQVPDEIADSVLGRFAEVGLIDDAAFARAWVESRHHGRGLARRALSAELRQRGVPDGDVRSAVSLLRPQDELAAARQLVARRVAASRGKPVTARARQLMGMLARKGYPAGLAAQVVREALEQEPVDGPATSEDLAWITEDSSGADWA